MNAVDRNLLLLLTLTTSNFNSDYPINPRRGSQRLIGGYETKIITFPYLVQLECENRLFCSGTIINDTTILSAAHCFPDGFEQGMQIRAGTSMQGGYDGMVRNIVSVTKHEEFGKNQHQYDYDIAVIRIAPPLTFSNWIQPIHLPKSTDKMPADLSFIVPGWGIEKEGGKNVGKLKYIEINLVNWQICNRIYEGIITDRMICAGSLKGIMDACQGDSGGPLVNGYTLYGIVSWGLGCARYRYPGLYTDIISLREWIFAKTGT